MKKIILSLVFSIFYSLVSAQVYTYTTSSVVNGRYYSSSGFVTVSGSNYVVPKVTWKWDVEQKVEEEEFNWIATDKTVSFLGRKFKYDTVIYDAGYPIYVNIKTGNTISKEKKTVMLIGKTKEIYYLK